MKRAATGAYIDIDGALGVVAQTNTGTISVTADATGSLAAEAYANGIGISAATAVVGTIDNAGTIRATAIANASGTGATNLGPTSAALIAQVADSRAAFEALNGTDAPIDAVTTSGSGLDPHLSPETARAQADRIAAARAADPVAVLALIDSKVEGRLFGLYGLPRVNALETNLALDEAFPMAPAAP